MSISGKAVEIHDGLLLNFIYSTKKPSCTTHWMGSCPWQWEQPVQKRRSGLSEQKLGLPVGKNQQDRQGQLESSVCHANTRLYLFWTNCDPLEEITADRISSTQQKDCLGGSFIVMESAYSPTISEKPLIYWFRYFVAPCRTKYPLGWQSNSELF